MMLRDSLRAVALMAIALACAGCGIKGPLYLPPKAEPGSPAATPSAAPSAAPAPPATAAPDVPPGPSSSPLPQGVTAPVERKSQ